MNQGLLEIRPPAAPADTLLLAWLALALAVLLLAGYLLLHHYHKAWRVRWGLHECRRGLVAGRLAPRAAANRLAQLLRQRLAEDRLVDSDAIRFTPEYDRQRWQHFIAQLEAARFSRASCPNTDIRTLLQEGSGWLRRIR